MNSLLLNSKQRELENHIEAISMYVLINFLSKFFSSLLLFSKLFAFTSFCVVNRFRLRSCIWVLCMLNFCINLHGLTFSSILLLHTIEFLRSNHNNNMSEKTNHNKFEQHKLFASASFSVERRIKRKEPDMEKSK